MRLGYAFILFASLFVVLLFGCQPVSSDSPSNIPFAITDKTVILDKTHVMGVKTTLYQPSFELQGVILPINKTNLISPTDGMAILVADMSQKHVFEGDALFTVTPAFFEEYTAPPVSVTAPFNGRLDTLYTTHNSVSHGDTLATFIDDSVYQFVSLLPNEYLPYLSVGQSVNFSPKGSQAIADNATAKSFAGQVAHIAQENGNLSVTVQIPPSTTQLAMGQTVGGWIDYGQLDVGVVVPDYAIADGVNLAALTTPPYKPAAPLPAHIWIIKQDGTLALTDIHIVKYQPDTEQYLVTGMSQDALIVTANLPKKADGMAVKIR